MSLKITHKYSTAAGTPPASGDIDVGEVAINAADAELYVKDSAGSIKKFANTDTTGTAAGVQFTQAGTGAVQRTVESKLQDVVSVKDFGAVGDGVADDTSAIQAAIDATSAAGGGTVFFPKGSYSVLTLAAKTNLVLEFERGAILLKQPGTLSDLNNAINALGTVTATTSPLSSNVSVGDATVSVTSAAGFAVGDWCLLRDNTWIVASSAGRNQEIVKIANISGTTVTLTSGTIGSYATASTAELVKINPIENLIINGARIIVPTGTNTGGGVLLDLCVQSDVRNCIISGMNDNAGLELARSYNINITGNAFLDGQNLAGSGYAYGISISESSHHIRATENHQQNIRESTATNRARFVVFANNTADGCIDSHFNTHGSGCENIVISNNACNSSQYGYAVGFSTHTAGDKNVLICNNTIANTGSHGISVAAPSGKENQDVVISDNHIFNCGLTTTANGISFSRTNGGLISTNLIDGNNQNNAAYGIQVILSTGIDVRDNSVSNLSNGYGIALNNATSCLVQSNATRNVSSFNYRTIGTNTSCSLINNTADDSLVSLSAVTQFGNSWGFAPLQTSQATTSGTEINFTNIPSSANRVTLILRTVSLSGSALIRFRLGGSSLATSGYVGNGSEISSTVATAAATDGFDIYQATPATSRSFSGTIVFTRVSSNNWLANGSFIGSTSNYLTTGIVSTTGVLAQVQITSSNGTDTFSTGTANIICE